MIVKALLITAGTISLGIGLIGIVVPGLPTTPFLLLTAACYLRSSRKLYAWLLSRKRLGKLVREYHELRALTFRTKAAALSLMATMIGVSAFVLVRRAWVRLLILSLGAVGAAVVLLLPTAPRDGRKPTGGGVG